MRQSATGERSEPVAYRNRGAVSYNSSLDRRGFAALCAFEYLPKIEEAQADAALEFRPKPKAINPARFNVHQGAAAVAPEAKGRQVMQDLPDRRLNLCAIVPAFGISAKGEQAQKALSALMFEIQRHKTRQHGLGHADEIVENDRNNGEVVRPLVLNSLC